MKLIHGEALEEMDKLIKEGVRVDLTVTSPPYDNLRTYNGNNEQWNESVWKGILNKLFIITKQGGVVVWVVNDATIKGSETGTSFKQALYAKSVGFNLHDTMIYAKKNPVPKKSNRYQPQFEYMFIFSKGKPKNFNPILVPTKEESVKKNKMHTFRRNDGTTEYTKFKSRPTKYKSNIWFYSVGGPSFGHPAIFPLQLATDHITTWSNTGDTVLDIFMGSGTTGVACVNTNRDFIGVELDEEYFNIAQERILNAMMQPKQEVLDI